MGYLNLVGSFVYKEPLFRSKLQALADNDAQLKTDGWSQNTKCLFYQASVPSGWTQDVSQNDKALRVVGPVGGGGSGGTKALSTTVTLGHTHALTTPSDGAHTHTYANHTHASGPSASVRPSTNIFADNGGFLYLYDTSGASSVTLLSGTLATVGALTLSTQAAHNHGTLSSSLTDAVFAYCDVIIGTKNAPGGTYTDLTSQWHTGDIINFDPFASYAGNDAYNLGNLMPAGTVMIFGQATAPDGWTLLVTINDRMLRVVSGSGGVIGGTQPTSSGLTLGHTHTLPGVAAHSHTVPAHQHSFGSAGSISNGRAAASAYGFVQDSTGFGPPYVAQCQQTLGLPTSSQTCYKTRTTLSGSDPTGLADAHTHTLPTMLMDLTLAYVDVIQCSKDSAGAPYAYTDYTAEFAWKKLVSYQRLNTLAKNDAYLLFHTTPFGSQAFFFMASPPAGWVKITSQHDKALRIVNGASGGSPGGGLQLLSATIPLAHTHVVPTDPDHTHTISHTHPLDSGAQTVVVPDFFLVQGSVGGVGTNFICTNNNVGSLQPGGMQINSVTQPPVEQPVAAGNHNHGGITDSQLTDIVLAYADVIWCTKS